MGSRVALSFCGCGFLGVYHLGVVSCLLKHGQGFLATVDRVAGASAGSLAAALVVTCPTVKHIQKARKMVMQVADNIRRKPLGALTPGYHVSDDVRYMLGKILPLDAHEKAEGKLFVSLTNVRSIHNEVVCHFESRKELIRILAASCHIPVYSGSKFPSLYGKPYCDGGLTNNLIHFKEGRTVTVSPFSGQQDIGPHDPVKHGHKPYFVKFRNQNMQVNFGNAERFRHALFPPAASILHQYYNIGQQETMRFLQREGMYEPHTSHTQ